MGMFDYFQIDVSLLPTVPGELKVGEDGRFTFQTKDTAMQAMCTYIQESGQALQLKRTSGEWVPGEPADENADFFSKLSSLGSYVVKETWYEEQTINDVISLYTNLRHADDDGTDRYASGWIEYVATYRDGIVKSIVVAEYTRPRVLTDEQVTEKRESIERSRAEMQLKLTERRMEHPTNEERLIDSIAEIAENRVDLYDEADLMHALNGITKLIEEYRERHDIHYRSPKRAAL
jgi:hypothetical protein